MAMMRMVKLTQQQLLVMRHMLNHQLVKNLRFVFREGLNRKIEEAEVLILTIDINRQFQDFDLVLYVLLRHLTTHRQVDGFLPLSKKLHASLYEIISLDFSTFEHPNVNPEIVKAAMEPIYQEQPGIVTAFNDAAWIDENDLPRGVVATQPGAPLLN